MHYLKDYYVFNSPSNTVHVVNHNRNTLTVTLGVAVAITGTVVG